MLSLSTDRSYVKFPKIVYSISARTPPEVDDTTAVNDSGPRSPLVANCNNGLGELTPFEIVTVSGALIVGTVPTKSAASVSPNET